MSDQTDEAAKLADKIGGFAKVRLCVNVDGTSHPSDWLLSERDRYLIARALRHPNPIPLPPFAGRKTPACEVAPECPYDTDCADRCLHGGQLGSHNPEMDV